MDGAQSMVADRCRIRIFVDFWNFSLSLRAIDERYKIDWSVLGSVLTKEAERLVEPAGRADYQGMNVYGSYHGENETKLHKWATTKLDTFPGVHVNMRPRQRKRKPPVCPACKAAVQSCPSCSADMRGTEEKGVDTSIVTDMISLAWEDNYDVAVLVSADKDFIPVVEFLERKGKKVLHGAFPPTGSEVTRKCWGSINLREERGKFEKL